MKIILAEGIFEGTSIFNTEIRHTYYADTIFKIIEDYKVEGKQVVMYLLREDFSVSYPLIGQKLGGKDHTTVIHSCLKIKEDLKNDPQLLQELEQIRIMFK